jgi:hypothetical protein
LSRPASRWRGTGWSCRYEAGAVAMAILVQALRRA